MYRILSTSRNVRLLLDRNSVLALAGFSVISPKYPEQTPSLAAQEKVDAVIIGHSVDPFIRKSIIRDLRSTCPRCVICFVYAAPETKGESLADASLDVTDGPKALIRLLQERLPRNTRAS
jgi:hypothetical protein